MKNFFFDKVNIKPKKIKILIMGLPGSGKTTLARKLKENLYCDWLNADKVRKKYKDWDFSKKGVLRQARRMFELAHRSKNNIIVADFICPYHKSRKLFRPDFIIWLDTIKKGRFSTFDLSFEKPKYYNLRLKKKPSISHVYKIISSLKLKWNEKKDTAQMLGRFQPFHDGHKALFEKIILSVDQVLIMVKNVQGIGDNPFSFNEIKNLINMKLLKKYKDRFKIIRAPNITKICYGRKVGYKFKKINLSENIQKISGTNIRIKMRKKGLL
jgi:hypothetical protein